MEPIPKRDKYRFIKYRDIKALDQPDHVIRFLTYQHFQYK